MTGQLQMRGNSRPIVTPVRASRAESDSTRSVLSLSSRGFRPDESDGEQSLNREVIDHKSYSVEDALRSGRDGFV